MSADDGDWVRTTGPSLTGTSGPPGGYPNGGKESEGSLKFGGGQWRGDKVGGGAGSRAEQGLNGTAPGDSKVLTLSTLFPHRGVLPAHGSQDLPSGRSGPPH